MEISQVEAQSQRVVQTYAWGNAVWHVWGAGGDACSETQGEVRGEPLVLLHGGSGSWTHWVRNVLHLAKYRTVWALDLPGCGDSDLPAGVADADDLVPYVADIFNDTFQGKAVDVMGFSFGAMTAGLVAAAHAHLIRQLVLVGAPGLGLFGRDLPMRGMLPDMDEAEQRAVHRHNLNAMMFVRPDTVNEDVVNLQQANVARDRLRRRRIARTDVLARAQAHWTCPVHGVWAEFDALYAGTLQQVPHVLSRMETFTVVPDAGHWVMFERADAFHAAIEPLLRR
jgi:pimeloyl-ACP methyl ester carboxylesterase